MLEYALEYLRRGWSVLPAAGKRPLLPSWAEYQQRRATEAEIREWWRRWPATEPAVVTGAVSGLVVVDADGPEGLGSIKPYLDGTTLTATTPGGGEHLYYHHPGGTVPCAVRILPGVDVRADGGIVVAPSGGVGRTWKNPGTALSLLPPGLEALVRQGPGKRRLDGADWVADIEHGERDQELTRRAGKLLATGMPAGEALAVMREVNLRHCKPPLPQDQVEKIVRSIASREAAKDSAAGAKPAPSKFTVVTQRDMLRRYSDGETRWTVEEWLPEGSCGLLVAPPGNFKTWILTALAFSIATGRPFLGKWAVHGKGPVLIIQQEDPWWMLQSRLGRMFCPDPPAENGTGQDSHYELDCRYVREFDDMPIYWYTDRELRFSDKNVLGLLEQKIAEIRPRAVLIDPLYTAADSKDYMAEGAQKMAALKVMRDKYQCSFVIAHHTTVAGASSEDRTAIWGSQFLNAWLEFGWRMPQGDDKGNIIVRHFKTSDTPKRIRLQFKITDWSFGVEIDDAPGTLTDRIEEIILKGAKMSERQLAEQLGCSKTAVHTAIKNLKGKTTTNEP